MVRNHRLRQVEAPGACIWLAVGLPAYGGGLSKLESLLQILFCTEN